MVVIVLIVLKPLVLVGLDMMPSYVVEGMLLLTVIVIVLLAVDGELEEEIEKVTLLDIGISKLLVEEAVILCGFSLIVVLLFSVVEDIFIVAFVDPVVVVEIGVDWGIVDVLIVTEVVFKFINVTNVELFPVWIKVDAVIEFVIGEVAVSLCGVSFDIMLVLVLSAIVVMVVDLALVV